MKNIKKLRLLAGLQALLLSGATLSCFTSCGDDSKTQVLDNPTDIVVDSTDDIDNSNIETSYSTDSMVNSETTYTTSKGVDSTKLIDVDVEETTTSFKPINRDFYRKKELSEGGSGVVKRTEASSEVVTIAPVKSESTKSSSKTTNEITSKTTAHITTSKVTSKTTAKTTTEPTTTVTTTTTEETQPVTEPVQEEYNINDKLHKAMTNMACLNGVTDRFAYDLMKSDEFFIPTIDLSYGETTGAIEMTIAFAFLNYKDLSQDVKSCFSSFDETEYNNFKEFIKSFGYVQSVTGNTIDFTKYVLDNPTAIFLNEAQRAYFDGTIDSFISNAIFNGSCDEYILDNPGVMGILCSYDSNSIYFNPDEIDANYLNPFVEYFSGYNYSK